MELLCAVSVDDASAARDARVDPDEDVLDLVRRGALRDALAVLMRRHGVAVYRYCREELGGRVLADDIHQQIFLQVYRDLPRFGGRSRILTWLLGVARHRVLDAAKSRRRHSAHLGEDEDADAVDPTPAPGECLDELRYQRAMLGCLRQLGEHVRGVLLLYYQQGVDFGEIAILLGEKPGTLRARVSRSLPRLRACIEAQVGDRGIV
jgi:RNA polymerase sigma-70 factor (ECF subfamily)